MMGVIRELMLAERQDVPHLVAAGWRATGWRRRFGLAGEAVLLVRERPAPKPP